MTIPTYQNELIVSIDGTTIMIDMSTVVNGFTASNGVVHVIDNVFGFLILVKLIQPF